jgi:hypothetical protein
VTAIARPSGTFRIHNACPNPTSTEATILVEMPEGGGATATLGGLRGKVLSAQRMEGPKGLNAFVIDLSAASPGTYCLQLSNGTAVLMQRIVRQ